MCGARRLSRIASCRRPCRRGSAQRSAEGIGGARDIWREFIFAKKKNYVQICHNLSLALLNADLKVTRAQSVWVKRSRSSHRSVTRLHRHPRRSVLHHRSINHFQFRERKTKKKKEKAARYPPSGFPPFGEMLLLLLHALESKHNKFQHIVQAGGCCVMFRHRG